MKFQLHIWTTTTIIINCCLRKGYITSIELGGRWGILCHIILKSNKHHKRSPLRQIKGLISVHCIIKKKKFTTQTLLHPFARIILAYVEGWNFTLKRVRINNSSQTKDMTPYFIHCRCCCRCRYRCHHPFNSISFYLIWVLPHSLMVSVCVLQHPPVKLVHI